MRMTRMKSVKPDAQYHFCDAMSDKGNDFSHRACDVAFTTSMHKMHSCHSEI